MKKIVFFFTVTFSLFTFPPKLVLCPIEFISLIFNPNDVYLIKFVVLSLFFIFYYLKLRLFTINYPIILITLLIHLFTQKYRQTHLLDKSP